MISIRLTLISAFALLSGTFVTLNATATLVSTGEGIDWFGYRSSGTQPTFNYEEEETTMTNLDGGSYVWGYLPKTIILDVGDYLTLSGKATFASITVKNVFYVGLYDSGENTKPSVGKTFSGIVDGTYDMTGFFAGTTSSSDPSKTQVFSRYQGKAPVSGNGGAGFMTTNQGADYIEGKTLQSPLSPPEANTAYDFSLNLLRTSNGYEIRFGEEVVTFSSEKVLSSNTFDVIGMKSPGRGITLSDLKVETTGRVVPEMSFFGLWGGVLVLLIAGTRRRKKKRE